MLGQDEMILEKGICNKRVSTNRQVFSTMIPCHPCSTFGFIAVTLLVVLSLDILGGITKIQASLDPDSLVKVYDNVLHEDTAEWLHQQCLQWPKGNSVSLFPLPKSDVPNYAPIVKFLDRLLHHLYPTTDDDGTTATMAKYYVEFWTRPKWHHIQAHADMDEGWEKQTQESPSTPLKHPETGHVLYLKVGRHVQGPTVVWNVTSGGEFLRMQDSKKSSVVEMITVPAVPGRLLRFQGNALHAVPRPANVYWTHREDDEDSFEEDLDQRSVLLFNLWPVEQGMLVGYEALKPIETASSPIPETATCLPTNEWTEVQPTPYQESSSSSSSFGWMDDVYRIVTSTYYETFWIPLMGNVRRRGGMSSRIVQVEAHHGVKDAFQERHQVTTMIVQPPKERILGFEL